MKLLYTVDTEMSLMMQAAGAMPQANFESAILGRTRRGDFGITYQLDMLDRFGLRGVFFVEALHTVVMGDEMLKRTVDLIASRGHDIELHCHVEWLWFSDGPLRLTREKQSLSHLDLEHQTELIGIAKVALERSGAPSPIAFRAGNFGANDDTLRALARLGLRWDSSLNRTATASRIALDPSRIAPIEHNGIIEVPVSWFLERPGRARPAQLCAVSSFELAHAVRSAKAAEHPLFVVVSHSFELLDRARTRPQPIVVRRLRALCRLLAERGIPTATFPELDATLPLRAAVEPAPVRSNLLRKTHRMLEQAAGHLLYERAPT